MSAFACGRCDKCEAGLWQECLHPRGASTLDQAIQWVKTASVEEITKKYAELDAPRCEECVALAKRLAALQDRLKELREYKS